MVNIDTAVKRYLQREGISVEIQDTVSNLSLINFIYIGPFVSYLFCRLMLVQLSIFFLMMGDYQEQLSYHQKLFNDYHHLFIIKNK